MEIVIFFFFSFLPILFTCKKQINVTLPAGIESFINRVKLNITGNF